ncbi:O-antigen ligase family protein [Bacillaceae bacterium S4-13-58]
MTTFSQASKFTTLLKYYIIFQPILDILTTASLAYLDTSLTVGIVIRVLFMGISLLYILFGNDSPYKKYVVWYLVALFGVLGIGFIINIFSKPVFNLFMEAQWLAKILYFVIMFSTLLLVFTTKENLEKAKERFLFLTLIAMMIVSGTILFSIITGTSSDTYEWVKAGFKGWFYSGNELSAIIGITFPLVYLYSVLKTDSLKKAVYWIPTIVLGIVGVLIGTKVGLFAMIGTAVIMFVVILLHWLFLLRKQGAKNEKTPQLLASLIFTIVFMAIIPATPSYTNLSVNMKVPDQEDIDKGFELEDELDLGGENGEPKRKIITLNSPILNKILSSRQIYFTWQYNQYIYAEPLQKVFGMGYAGNYIKNRKTIEMDFFDIFFSFGIFGSILILLPLFILVGIVVKNLFTNVTKVFKIENVAYMVSIGLASGIALIAGHVWFAPAVSIYLALAMILLLTNFLNKSKSSELV